MRKGGSRCFAVVGENQYHCIFGGANCFIVHPSDTAPALVALDAELKIAGSTAPRVCPWPTCTCPRPKTPTRETTLAPGELIVEVHLPAPPEGRYTSYRKIRTRRAWDFAIAGCALALHMDRDTVRDCRVVLSGAAPVPWRSNDAEQALCGKNLDHSAIRDAASAAVANAEPTTKNAYKVPLSRNMLVEELGNVKQG